MNEQIEQTGKAFSILPSYVEGAQYLSKSDRNSFYAALLHYGTFGEIIDMTNNAMAVFVAIRPSIDKSREISAEKREAGLRSGEARREKAEKEKAEKAKKEKAEPNTTETCSQPVQNMIEICSPPVQNTSGACSHSVPNGVGVGEGVGVGVGVGVGEGVGTAPLPPTAWNTATNTATDTATLSTGETLSLEKATAPVYPPDQITPQHVLNQYHSICTNLQAVASLTKNREKMIQEKLQNFGFERILQVFNLAQNSDFLCGKKEPEPGKKPFKATFDWLMDKEENFVKTLEGNYSKVFTMQNFNTQNHPPQSLYATDTPIDPNINPFDGTQILPAT